MEYPNVMIKLIDILKENKILVPRRSPEERQKNYTITVKKQIEQYIKDGSKGDLNLRELKDGSILPLDLKVGGDLDLKSVTSIPEGFNPTVDGFLDLNNVTSIPKGFNLTVGGGLYLQNITSIPEGFNPTVGGDLYLSKIKSHTKEELEKMLTNVKGIIII